MQIKNLLKKAWQLGTEMKEIKHVFHAKKGKALKKAERHRILRVEMKEDTI